jgi:hypothetical protein
MRMISTARFAMFAEACRKPGRIVRIVGVAAVLTSLAACALPRVAAVPEQGTTLARVTDIPNARFYLDSAGIAAMNREAFAALERERAAHGAGALPTANLLALSGGGQDGAFGAGLLTGWTENHTRPRPEFKLVTGVSAGALIAPFAFLGPEYDPTLRRIFTETAASGVYKRQSLLSIIDGDSVVDTGPLLQSILSYLDDDVIARIAQGYRNGRLLLIGTTNLDVGRSVIWNIGAIAASGHPNTREFIAKILLASASVPAVFPPVFFDAEFDGQHYQEMHVDGGTVANTFLYPPGLNSRASMRPRIAYVVRNGTFDVHWESVKRQTLAIAGRAVSTLSASNTVGDIYRIYETTKRDGVAFNLAYIGDDFQYRSSGQFDPEYIRSLMDYGFEKGRMGYPWKKLPPGLSIDPPRGVRTSQQSSASLVRVGCTNCR